MSLRFRILFSIALLAVLAMLWGWRNATAEPVVRRATVALPGWPAGARPVTAALLGDIHMAGATMNEGRLSRIVARVNALHPDIVLIAGDFVAGHEVEPGKRFARRLTVPLGGLSAPLGTVAVFGNHDHWTSAAAVRTALEKAGITVLANDAVQRGPLVVVGIDDSATAHADVGRSVAAANRLSGARVALTHDPQLSPYLTPDLTLLLGGHTHCGQVVLPIVGPLGHGIYDERYECGVIREPARTTIVTAGLGTSVLPLRYGAPPDLWLVTLGPAGR